MGCFDSTSFACRQLGGCSSEEKEEAENVLGASLNDSLSPLYWEVVAMCSFGDLGAS